MTDHTIFLAVHKFFKERNMLSANTMVNVWKWNCTKLKRAIAEGDIPAQLRHAATLEKIESKLLFKLED